MGKAEAANDVVDRDDKPEIQAGGLEEIQCARCGSFEPIAGEVLDELEKLNQELRRRGEPQIDRARSKHCASCKETLLRAVQRSRTRQFQLRLEGGELEDEAHLFDLWRSGQISKDELPPRLRVTRWAQIRAIEEAREAVRAREIKRLAEESKLRDRVPGEDDLGEPVGRCEHGYRLDAICFLCGRVE